MGCSKSSSNGEVSGNKSLPEDMRKTPNKQPKLTPKATRKRTTTKKKKNPNWAEEIIKIKAKIKWKRNERKIANINKN